MNLKTTLVLLALLVAGGVSWLTYARLRPGEAPGDSNRFSRPTYVRIDDGAQVLRLAPGLIAAIDRPQDHYMQRRLFPAERVTETGEGERAEKVERLAAKAVGVESSAGKYEL